MFVSMVTTRTHCCRGRRSHTPARAIVSTRRGETKMPFFNNIYYPYQADSQGAQTSVGISSLLNSPQSQQSSNSQQTASVATMSTSMQASAAVPLPPFRFRLQRESVDWRRIGALDVDRVASELDFQTLQEHIAGVTFCSIEAERCQRCQAPVDSAVLKLFRLSQLTVEYLLHSQDYLSLSLQAAEERVQAEQREKEQIHLMFQKHADELKTLKDELKQRKKIITSQQAMISTGIAGYNKCQHCDKAFMNATFLHSHMQRRHPDEYDFKLLTDTQKKVQSVRFQEEINKLKEQLSLTRSQLETQQQACVAKAAQEKDLSEKQEELKQDLEKWKADEKRSMNRQIDEIRESCQRDVHSLYQKNALLEKQLAKVQETNLVLGVRVDLEEKKRTPHKDTKKRSTRPDTLDGGTYMLGEVVKHQQEILKLEHQVQTQEEKWSARLLKIQKEHETVKNQLSEDLQHLQKCVSEQSCRQMEQPGTQLLKEPRHQATQVKQVSASPPTIVVKHEAPGPEPKAKPLMHEPPVVLHKLDPIVELSEEERDSSSKSDSTTIVREVQERVKEFLKNPGAKREMREIVERSLWDELHSLGIRPETQGLCKGEYERLMMEVHQKRSELVKDTPQCQRLRLELSHSLDQRVKDRLAGYSSGPEKQHRTKDTPVALSRTMYSSLPSKGSRLVSDVPAKQLQTPHASHRSSTKALPHTSTPKTPEFSSDDDSEEGLVPQSLSGSLIRTQPTPVPRGNIPQVVLCQERSGPWEEEDGEWTEGSELEEIDLKQPQHSSPVAQNASGKKAHGHHVKDLTRSLENQLADRGPPRLAGSVNTINTANSFGTNKNSSKRKDVVEEHKYKDADDDDDDDDDDDWDISSLDDVSKPTSSLNIVQKTLDSTSTSVWGPSTGHTPKPGLTEAGTGSTLKSSLVSFSDWSSSDDA
ncbi:zinc finger protein Dzip1 isoform X1 [Clupea harengus]|uniref:Zinc finger protein Dzip1 isoform X1 n=2 Tax=Clupea harengus TaxID=7950 RepID=A0A8M1KDP6_CLUHA|nr:zinc finger protein Dzip1 isoform X1 [Clupea harengus]